MNKCIKVVILCAAIAIVQCVPYRNVVKRSIADSNDIDESEINNATNSTGRDLYVIRAVVYEIGILSDHNDTETSLEDNEQEGFTHEQIDLTFFDAHQNGTHLDLGSIPLPLKIANITEQILTGIAPVQNGTNDNLEELLASFPFNGTSMEIAKSDSGFISLTSHNITLSNLETKIETLDDLDKIPSLFNTSMASE